MHYRFQIDHCSLLLLRKRLKQGKFEAVMKERETRSIKQNISLNSNFFGDGDRKFWSNTAQCEMHIREYVRLKEI